MADFDPHTHTLNCASCRRELRDIPNAKLEHVRREFNSEADSLANMAMDSRRSTSDYKCPGGETGDHLNGGGDVGEHLIRDLNGSGDHHHLLHHPLEHDAHDVGGWRVEEDEDWEEWGGDVGRAGKRPKVVIELDD